MDKEAVFPSVVGANRVLDDETRVEAGNFSS